MCIVRMSLEHLPIPHLDRQEHHHQRREPNSTGTKPKNTGASVGKQLRSGVGGDNACQTTQARQHSTDAATVTSIEELRRRGVENSIEVLVRLLAIGKNNVGKKTHGLHDVLERVETHISSSVPHLRVHGHGKPLADS